MDIRENSCQYSRQDRSTSFRSSCITYSDELVPTTTNILLGRDRDELKLSLVLPTYNEGGIESIIGIISQFLDPAIAGEYELIVVDDDSPDRTWEIAAA